MIYNRSTGLYVLWLNTPDPDQNGYRVLASSNPRGPFRLVGRPELHDLGIPDSQGNPGARDGDEGLFVDSNGIAWLVWDRVGRLLQERLSSSYTTGIGSPSEILNYPEILPDAGVESPSEFQYRGHYYIAVSLPRCGYCTGTGRPSSKRRLRVAPGLTRASSQQPHAVDSSTRSTWLVRPRCSGRATYGSREDLPAYLPG